MALDKDTAGQLAAVHVALPNLDPKDVSNPKAPIQHLNRRDRAGFMPYSAEDETYHGDGAWPRRWRKGRTDRGNKHKEAETLDSEDTDEYTTPVHESSTPMAPPKLIRSTRAQSQWRHTVSGTDSDLLEAVAASLQTGSLEPAALKPCRKRKGSSLLATQVVRECPFCNSNEFQHLLTCDTWQSVTHVNCYFTMESDNATHYTIKTCINKIDENVRQCINTSGKNCSKSSY